MRLGQETCRLVTFGCFPLDNVILVYLTGEFARIQKEFGDRGGSIPEGWPGVGIVKQRVSKARGLFQYWFYSRLWLIHRKQTALHGTNSHIQSSMLCIPLSFTHPMSTSI
jgi:hypothetical protein